jgi:hypothetical protein
LRLLIGVVQGNSIRYLFWGPTTKGKTTKDKLELDLALKQPDVQENVKFWNKASEHRKYYGLLILMDNNKGTKSYAPIETKEEFERLLSLGRTNT